MEVATSNRDGIVQEWVGRSEGGESDVHTALDDKTTEHRKETRGGGA